MSINGRYSFIAIFISLFFTQLAGQTYELDGIKLATHQGIGSARYMAVGGAFTSVGAEYTNASHNPAGIGMFRSSLVMITPIVKHTQVSSSYLNQSKNNQALNLHFGNFGFVFGNSSTKSSTIQSTAFGIGINRMADYNRQSTFNAYNTTLNNSITNSWVSEVGSVNGSVDGPVDFDQFSFEAVNAYQTYLVNYDTAVMGYTSPVTNSIEQRRYVETSGGKSEIVLSGGANYLDKLYFGASIGLPIVSYDRFTSFIETDSADVNGDFRDFELKQYYKTSGLGLNFKAGVIYKPAKFIRLGLAIHTPERISLTENYSSEIESNFDAVSYDYSSPEGEFDYTIRLPWRAKAGLSLFYKKLGFLSIDYEIVDYGFTEYNFGSEYQSIAEPINTTIREKYGYAHNISAGLEVVIKNMRVRAGYGYIDSPLNEAYAEGDNDFSIHRYSAGMGFVWDKIALDFTGVYSASKEYDVPYRIPGSTVQGVAKDIRDIQGMLTVSYRFN